MASHPKFHCSPINRNTADDQTPGPVTTVESTSFQGKVSSYTRTSRQRIHTCVFRYSLTLGAPDTPRPGKPKWPPVNSLRVCVPRVNMGQKPFLPQGGGPGLWLVFDPASGRASHGPCCVLCPPPHPICTQSPPLPMQAPTREQRETQFGPRRGLPPARQLPHPTESHCAPRVRARHWWERARPPKFWGQKHTRGFFAWQRERSRA